jgi:hypothetical protein
MRQHNYKRSRQRVQAPSVPALEKHFGINPFPMVANSAVAPPATAKTLHNQANTKKQAEALLLWR